MAKSYFIKIVFRLFSLMNLIILISISAMAQQHTNADKRSIRVTLQKRGPLKTGDKNFIITRNIHQWDPTQTAIIICDMWDKHWCKDATTRVNELAPKINEVISIARSGGVLIVHAPSGC